MIQLKRVLVLSILIIFLIFEILLAFHVVKHSQRFSQGAGNWIFYNFIVILSSELLFQLFIKIYTGSFYQKVEKIKFKDIFLEPHPFIPYVHKRNYRSHVAHSARYPLHLERHFQIPPLNTNNYRHADGILGSRTIVQPKPKDQIRILCLGGSTTGNYLSEKGAVSSYPIELEWYLQRRFPDKSLVVHNCGHGGWTSAEILIDFLLNLKDTNPDIIVIYHAHNDLLASLTSDFVEDYSHAKRNLGESYYKYRLTSFIPTLPLGVYNFIIQTLFPYINPRAGVLEAIAKGKIDINGEFKGLKTYERNLEYLVKLCLLDKIDVVLSTFAHYLYDEVQTSKIHLKYQEGVHLENRVMHQIAARHHISLVDNAHLVPQNAKYFVDSMHFTPEGMRFIAKNIGIEVAKKIESRFQTP